MVLALAAVIVIQSKLLSRLSADSETFADSRDQTGRISPSVEHRSPDENQSALIKRLRSENQELHKLRNEVRQLREQKQQTEALRLEMQRLQAQNLELRERGAAVASGSSVNTPPADRRGAWLGVGIRGVPATFTDAGSGVQAVGGGVQIFQIHPNTPAGQSALQTNDIITAIDGRVVASIEEFKAQLREKSPGQSIGLDLIRNGAGMRLRVQTGSVPEALPSPAQTP